MSLDFQRLEQVLAEAAARADPGERAAYLAEACGNDQELRTEVERLLAANEQAGDFLETPVGLARNAEGGVRNSDSPESDGGILQTPELMEKPGTMIGRYKLLEEIGEGGFGVVFMAEQQEPVHRQVALKIVKAGMDTREVIARFEAERQALALMDHPNIARVFDGGVTQAGRPYFVMELVQGIAITEFCDQRNLTTGDRLQLFIQVCHAVQHAHQKGIIHRDLKPSNILVTLIDGEPVPKVIDFGVAKALGRKLTDRTLFTGFLKMVGTPAYMSPEQADLSGVDIDTRADIYALGVLLYELLTGVTPFDAETLRQAALDEIRRVIREAEPPKPSTRLQTLVAADVRRLKSSTGTATEEEIRASSRRLLQDRERIRLVRGDLDWIVMKCLEKDRGRRYETANNLALDVEHHLRQEPVSAVAPSVAYRARKFIRRHRTGLAMTMALFLLLAASAVVSSWQAVRATGAESKEKAQRMRAEQERNRAVAAEKRAQADERRARIEAAKSQQVAKFLKDMLWVAGPIVVTDQDTTLLREILDRTAKRAGKDLKDQPEVEAELYSLIGNTYFELGDYPKAEELQRQALRLRRALFGETNRFVADSLNDLSLPLQRRGVLPEAETLRREALAIKRHLFGNEHPDVAKLISNLADLLLERGQPAEAETIQREALAIQRRLLPKPHTDLLTSLTTLGLILDHQGKLIEAEAVWREALAMSKELWGNENLEASGLLGRLGSMYRQQGRLTEAEALCRQALAIRRKAYGNEHRVVANALSNLARVLRDQGKLQEAADLLLEGLSIRKRVLGPEQPETLRLMSDLADTLLQQGKVTEAEAYFREVLATQRQTLGAEHAHVGWASSVLAGVLWREGNLVEAETHYRKALSILRKELSAGDPFVGSLIGWIAALLRAQGRPAEAESLHREELARLRGLAEDAKVSVQVTLRMVEQMDSLGLLMRDRGNYAEAAAIFQDALALHKQVPGDNDPVVTDLLFNLATTLISQGKVAEAQLLVRKVAESGNAAHLNNFAWLLATCADPNGRDGQTAMSCAERAVSKTGRTNATYLDTLAAAYASAGHFTNAVRAEKEAIGLFKAKAQKQDGGLRLKLYMNGIPYRDHGALATRATTLLQQGKFEEAEFLARECLALRENLIPDNWLTCNARSLLGGSLLGQKKYAEAEPVLVSGYEGMKQREGQIPAVGKPRLQEALQRLVQLYEATSRPEKAAEWRQKLTESAKPQAFKQAGTP